MSSDKLKEFFDKLTMPQVTDQENVNLTAPLCLPDLLKAIKETPNGKARGPEWIFH